MFHFVYGSACALTSFRSSPTSVEQRGLDSDVFKTTVFPHIIGTVTARMVSGRGAFQGAME